MMTIWRKTMCIFGRALGLDFIALEGHLVYSAIPFLEP
jgi:hypothetical protein